MKFFTNKIQVTAKPAAAPPMPAAQPLNAHNTPETNTFHDLEKPELKNFSMKPPTKVSQTGEGRHGAAFHYGEDGNRESVVKSDANSVIKEPLAYHIGEHLAPGLVPPTVIRNHTNRHSEAGEMVPHSVQQAVPGKLMAHVPGWDWRKLRSEHPDYSRMGIFDYIMGNTDRHEHNAIYDGPMDHPDYGNLEDIPFGHPMEGRIHAIDNGGAFNYKNDKGPRSQIKNNMSWSVTPIPEDFRNNILNADEAHLKGLFDRARAHPLHDYNPTNDYTHLGDDAPGHIQPGFMLGNFENGTATQAWQGFKQRLAKVKKHLANPEVETARDLSERLYPARLRDTLNQMR